MRRTRFRKSLARATSLALAGWFCTTAVAHADALTPARTAWNNGEYAAAARMISALERGVRLSGEALYIQGTSACRVPRIRGSGRVLLANLVTRPLTREQRLAARIELANCGRVDHPQAYAVASVIPASMSINSKVFYWIDRRMAPLSQPVEVDPIDEGALLARRLPAGDPRAGAVAREQLAGCTLLQTAHFTLCSTSGHDEAQLRGIANQVEGHIAWLNAAFGFAPPSSGGYIYLVPTLHDLAAFGARAHGVELAYGTIGYSLEADHSVAAIATGKNIGTVLHEVTLLVMDEAFPNAPEWLEEGLASLYETSKACGGTLLGAPNWRGGVLRQPWAHAVTLGQAVRAPWFTYRPDQGYLSSDTRNAAVFYSLSRSFMRYLQTSNDLGAVIRAFRKSYADRLDRAQNLDESLPDVTPDIVGEDARLLERLTGRSLAENERLVRSATDAPLDRVPQWANAAAAAAGLARCEDLQEAPTIAKSIEVDED